MKLQPTKFENISVTADARVFNTKTGAEIKPYLNKSNKYLYVNLPNKWISLHKLVCEAFHGAPVGDACFVDHINDIKDNNHKDNLRWVTRKENNAKSYKARAINKVEPHLTFDQLDDMFAEYLTDNHTVTGIAKYMNEKYGRKSLNPTYSQVLRGVNCKKYWETLSDDVKAAVIAITQRNRKYFG